MKVAVLADIHGNLRALEAVLADAKDAGAQQYIFLGDLIYMGLDPQLCFELLMKQKPLATIKGNSDLYLEEIPKFVTKNEDDERLLKQYKYASIRMFKESRETVAGFVPTATLDIEGTTLLCCHGSPYSDTEGLYENKPFSASLAKKLSKETAAIVLSAHTHVPADFTRDEKRFINPGAVGFSLDGDTRASYALLTVGQEGISVRTRRVEYDINRYKMEVEHAIQSFPLFEGLLYALNHGQMMVS